MPYYLHVRISSSASIFAAITRFSSAGRLLLTLVGFGLLMVQPTHAAETLVTICHLPPGNPTNSQIISVNQQAATEHIQLHGDVLLDGASERCDGIDNTCDNFIDEGFELDVPCDHGLGACYSTGYTACNPNETGLPVCDAEIIGAPGASCDEGPFFDGNCNGTPDVDEDECGSNACDLCNEFLSDIRNSNNEQANLVFDAISEGIDAYVAACGESGDCDLQEFANETSTAESVTEELGNAFQGFDELVHENLALRCPQLTALQICTRQFFSAQEACDQSYIEQFLAGVATNSQCKADCPDPVEYPIPYAGAAAIAFHENATCQQACDAPLIFVFSTVSTSAIACSEAASDEYQSCIAQPASQICPTL